MPYETPDVQKKRKETSRIGRFFSGVLILTAANLLIKFIGLLFKIPMNYIVGDTGMGYYGSAYSIYTFFYMLETAGLPVAVSILVSESLAEGNRGKTAKVFRLALGIFAVLGCGGAALMLLFSGKFADLIGSPPASSSIAVIAPTVLFVCISGAYRGYFEGHQRMGPVACAQLIEAICKLVFGVAAAQYSIRMGNNIAVTAAYAVFGLTVGSFLGMVFLMVAKAVLRPSEALELPSSTPTAPILRQFWVISLPITVSSAVMSLSGLIDTVLIQRLLQTAGMAQEEATTIYGNYTSLAVPMFNLPPVLIYPITSSLIPLLSAARTSVDLKKTKQIVESALRAAVVIGLPCAFGLSALAEPILQLFFKDSSAHTAAPLLCLLAPSSFFLCLLAMTNAVLQASGRAGKPVIAMLVGVSVKTSAELLLIPRIGMAGTPISTLLCYFMATVINLYYVKKYTGACPEPVTLFFKPLLAGILCGGSAYGSYRLLLPMMKGDLAVLCGVLVGASCYFAVILLTKTVTMEELQALPGIRGIGAVFAKLAHHKTGNFTKYTKRNPIK